MKRFGFIVLALIILSSFTISGCSSAQKKLSEDVKGIKTKVDTLETRVEGVETKQSEVERLAMEQAQKMDDLKAEKASRQAAGRSNISVKHKGSRASKEHIKEIQTYLKNAGFYQGEIDGVKGRKTRAAIKKFQKENGLTADGVVGKRTWQALNKYASGGAEQAAMPVEEEASAK